MKVITATKGEWKLNRTTYKGSPINELHLADERLCTLSNASIIDLIGCLSEAIGVQSNGIKEQLRK